MRKKTERVLEDLGCDPSTMISISLVDAGEMTELNLTYRGKESVSNVLAFSQLEGNQGSPVSHLLGDVVICGERAVEDAHKLGYTVDEMAVYLLIHGILHLVGYSHDLPQDQEEMNEMVQRIFDRFYPNGL